MSNCVTWGLVSVGISQFSFLFGSINSLLPPASLSRPEAGNVCLAGHW